MAYSRHGPIDSGIAPFGIEPGSSTAARRPSRSPARNAASILRNRSASPHRSDPELNFATSEGYLRAIPAEPSKNRTWSLRIPQLLLEWRCRRTTDEFERLL